MQSEEKHFYEFGDFRFDGKLGKLWQSNKLVMLSPKATQLLEFLLEKKGEFVSKEEIFARVWADTFVEDGVLTQNIYTLRKTLGANPEGLPLIENKTRLGYRITAPVNLSANQSNGFHKPENNGVHSLPKNLDGEQTSVSEIINNNKDFPVQKNNKKFIAVILGLLVIVSGAFLGWILLRDKTTIFYRSTVEPLKFTRLTKTGDLSSATISPDADFLAFIRGGKMFLKDIASDKEIPLDIPNATAFNSPQFSPDGNFIYFRNGKSPHAFAQIMKTSRFGGEAQIVAEKSYATFGISPDGKSLAYYTVEMPDASMRLIVKNLETKETREIYASGKSSAAAQNCVPAWSPDGKKILHVNQLPGNQPSELFVIDAASGEKDKIELPRLRRFEQASWHPDGKSFFISATEYGRFFHLWKIDYPSGNYQPITNGLNSYKNIAVSADGKKILALQAVEDSNIYMASASNLNEQTPVTTGNSNNFGQSSLNWINGETLLFSSQNDHELVENLWSTNVAGSNRKQVTNEREFSATTPTSDGNFVYYSINRNGVTNISRVDLNGENLYEITDETEGVRRSPQIAPDKSYIYYILRQSNGVKIMRRAISNGKEEAFFENEKVKCGTFLTLSPDGKFLACPNWRAGGTEDGGRQSFEIAVFSTENKDDVRLMQITGTSLFRFSPDSKALDFIAPLKSGNQIMRQAFDETAAKSILQMPEAKIFNFAWSKNGSQIALSNGQSSKDAVLLTNF